MKKKVIIDCDPGIDDAAAIIMALKLTDLEVVGITTVAGNMPLHRTTENALKLVELSGAADIPVYSGSEKPLRRCIDVFEENLFGNDGLGDILLPQPSMKAKEDAVDFILKTLDQSEQLFIITIGPMTNLAKALLKKREVFLKTAGIYSMGGAVLTGNVTPVAEFNYWADPDAAEMIYKSGIPIHMIGLNVTESVLFTRKHQRQLLCGKKEAAALGEMLTALFRFEEKSTGKNEIALHDVLAVVSCVKPELFDWIDCHIDISTTDLTRGECLADIVDAWGYKKNCHMAVKADNKKLMEFFFHTMLPDTDVVRL